MAFSVRLVVIAEGGPLVTAAEIIHDLNLSRFEEEILPELGFVHDGLKRFERGLPLGVQRLASQLIAVRSPESGITAPAAGFRHIRIANAGSSWHRPARVRAVGRTNNLDRGAATNPDAGDAFHYERRKN